jgi:hypothetical protein
VMCKQVVTFDRATGHCGAVMAMRDDAGRVKVGSEEEKQPTGETPLPN